MISTKTRKKIISAVIAGGVVLSLGGVAFAQTAGNSTGAAKAGQRAGRTVLSKVVKAPMNEDGEAFKSFVEDGTISQEQADKIKEFMKSKMEEKKTKLDKIKDKIKEAKEAFLKQQLKDKEDKLNELVTAGIISQEQANKIMEKMPQGDRKMIMKGGNFEAPVEKITASLSTLVEKGTINQETADKIKDFIAKKQEERKAEFEKMKDMTKEERQALISKLPKEKTDLCNEMVTAGIITSEQADAIKQEMQKDSKGMNKKGFIKDGFKGKKPGVKSSTEQS